MLSLEEVQAEIKPEMEAFESHFRQSMKSSVPLLNYITRYILKRKGKQMRPMFVFLSAKLNGEISSSTYTAASLIELLHTATLVHDDVVDNSNLRRGFFSINALWKNKIAVLVGDYLLSRGLLIAIEAAEYKLLQIVSESVRQMSEGELLQIEKARKLDVDEAVYFEIIRKKTASLIASCCACGTASVTANQEIIDKMKSFGEKVGIAFQIKDDLFDYEKSISTGKPSGIDIRDQKMTLPLIYHLNQCTLIEKRKIIYTIKHRYKNNEKIARLIKDVEKSGGIDYAKSKMYEYRDQALEILKTLPQNNARIMLEKLVHYTIERNK